MAENRYVQLLARLHFLLFSRRGIGPPSSARRSCVTRGVSRKSTITQTDASPFLELRQDVVKLAAEPPGPRFRLAGLLLAPLQRLAFGRGGVVAPLLDFGALRVARRPDFAERVALAPLLLRRRGLPLRRGLRPGALRRLGELAFGADVAVALP